MTMSDPLPTIKRILGFPEPVNYPQLTPQTAPTPDYEADTERLLADSQHFQGGTVLHKAALTEAQVVATAWSANELHRIADTLEAIVKAVTK
jgi:hypothetical protein